MALRIMNEPAKVKVFTMVEMDERDLLLQSFKVYLEELAESGIDELPFATTVGAAGAAIPAPKATALEPAQATALEPARTSAFDPAQATASESVQATASESAQANTDACFTALGNPRARLLFVQSGAGFAGASGELLVKIIEAMGFAPQDVLLLSFAAEGGVEGYPSRASLLARIMAVAPEVVVSLGETATQLLMQSRDSLASLRGRFLDLDTIPLMATLHPDQLVADVALKREVWSEMQQVMRRLAQAR
jgi:uracil-DNA glycosylase